MGSFSWLRADGLTKQNNIVPGDKIKFLIPAEFGGGFIKGMYDDYGMIETEDGFRFDVYDILTVWNRNELLDNGHPISEYLSYEGDELPLDIVGITENVRSKYHSDYPYPQPLRYMGIEVGCYDWEIAKLKYPLKLVSLSFDGTYETCKHRSYGDPNQGFHKTYWKETPKLKEIGIYPVNGTQKDIEEYWCNVADNEKAVIRNDALNEIASKRDALVDLRRTLTCLSESWDRVLDALNTDVIDVNDFICDEYPFDKSFDEIPVISWIKNVKDEINVEMSKYE